MKHYHRALALLLGSALLLSLSLTPVAASDTPPEVIDSSSRAAMASTARYDRWALHYTILDLGLHAPHAMRYRRLTEQYAAQRMAGWIASASRYNALAASYRAGAVADAARYAGLAARYAVQREVGRSAGAARYGAVAARYDRVRLASAARYSRFASDHDASRVRVMAADTARYAGLAAHYSALGNCC